MLIQGPQYPFNAYYPKMVGHTLKNLQHIICKIFKVGLIILGHRALN